VRPSDANGARALSRRRGDGRAAAPVSHVHLGLGSFFRAHQAVYTDHAPDRDDWGIAAFTGRRADLADALNRQDNLYTLVTRGAEDRFDIIASLSASHPAADHQSFLRYLASARTRVLTLTVTEAGYHRDLTGGLDRRHPDVQADLSALRAAVSQPVRTIPARIAAGLAARRAADAGPVTIVSCDNLPNNGDAVAEVVTQFAAAVDPSLAAWIGVSVSFVNTVVDRITPQLDPADIGLVATQTHRADHAPVVTEPYSEWIIDGRFPAGRPGWEHAGATFTDLIAPYQDRKLWLLNGGHSLLAYTGLVRGHETVADAVADENCRSWLEQWWREAAGQLDLPDADITAYRAALLSRFDNRRIRHQLAQIGADGSVKIPIRVLPVVHAERALGRIPYGGLRILAGWFCYLRGDDVVVSDPSAASLAELAQGPHDFAARNVLRYVDDRLGQDDDVVAAVTAMAQEMRQSS
jgi:fructuronate reductase